MQFKAFFNPLYTWNPMAESFQDYSCIQDFEDDFPQSHPHFPQKVILKMLN